MRSSNRKMWRLRALELKCEFPKECKKVLKLINKGIISKGEVAAKFPGEHVDYNIDWLVKKGLISRSYVREEKRAKIMLEPTGVKCKLVQGHKCNPAISERNKL